MNPLITAPVARSKRVPQCKKPWLPETETPRAVSFSAAQGPKCPPLVLFWWPLRVSVVFRCRCGAALQGIEMTVGARWACPSKRSPAQTPESLNTSTQSPTAVALLDRIPPEVNAASPHRHSPVGGCCCPYDWTIAALDSFPLFCLRCSRFPGHTRQNQAPGPDPRTQRQQTAPSARKRNGETTGPTLTGGRIQPNPPSPRQPPAQVGGQGQLRQSEPRTA